MNTQPPTAAAGEHFADAERILAALPLVKRSAERDRHVQVALVHATLAIAAILADEDDCGPVFWGRQFAGTARLERSSISSPTATGGSHS